MAGLNTRETAELREACAIIQMVLREGYDPKKAAVNDIQMTRIKITLERANKQVNAIVQMKGYYSS